MAEFLRHLARELENNKALARRLAEPFENILQESLAEQRSAAKNASKGKTGGKQKQYPVPDGFDPYQIFYDKGSPGLYNALSQLEIDEIKGVLARFTTVARKNFTRKQNRETLVQMAVQEVKDVATRGQAFGDYKLDT